MLFLSPCQLPPLHLAAIGGDQYKVEELVQKGADVNDKDIRSGVRILDCMYLQLALLIWVLVSGTQVRKVALFRPHKLFLVYVWVNFL